ncbi:hypothetical protein [Nocardia otitidiscaviarum]|uniref:hypothetical protein n=1 Tax=Nocardia otitidiscaviarum TaxID=1823 RepID=UPI0004A6E7F1|nr:hypothetical protein [Nocardia otitidiscaviarum]
MTEIVLVQFGGQYYKPVRWSRVSLTTSDTWTPGGLDRRTHEARGFIECGCGNAEDWDLTPDTEPHVVCFPQAVELGDGKPPAPFAVIQTPILHPICEHWMPTDFKALPAP